MNDKPERYVLRKKTTGQCFRSATEVNTKDPGMVLHRTFDTEKEAREWMNENCTGAAFDCEK